MNKTIQILVTLLAFVAGAPRLWAQENAEGARDSHERVASAHQEDAHEEKDGHGGGGHSDPVAPLLLGIIVILLAAKLGGDVFERIKMPAVLGELVVGVILGNWMMLTGLEWFQFLHAPAQGTLGDPFTAGAALKMLAGIGVVLLLFEVGLESTVADMAKVGASAFVVACLGVIAPMGLGYLCGLWLLPESGWQVHVFIGACLSATSVGITARVLKDIGRSQDRESKIILGAAVIDDVLGLIVLAVVSGVIQSGAVDAKSLVIIVGKSVGFLAGAILLGKHIARPLFKVASCLKGRGLLLAAALCVCFGFSWLANALGLAPIVGAFAAGLILEKVHYRELTDRGEHELEELLHPLTGLLVPIFFVQMGIQVDLKSMTDPSVWGLAAAITAAAIIGKQICAVGVLEKGLNRLAVGVGMIPRGEVGLIFAGVGLTLVANGKPVVSSGTYSAIIVMVMVTTMVTPPILAAVMKKRPAVT